MTPESRTAQVDTLIAWPAVIAIDGPAGSGKSTIGGCIAERLGYLFFDSGILYRALTWLALRYALPLSDEPALIALAKRMNIMVRPPTRADGRPYTVEADGEDITWDLRRPELGYNVSEGSKHPGVRTALFPHHRYCFP